MKNKNIVIVIIIILIVLSGVYIFNLEIPHQLNKNSHDNDTIKINNTNKDINKNSSPSNDYFPDHQNSLKLDKKTQEKYLDNSSDEALMAKKMVEKYALNKNEIAKYPIYKHHRLNSWLIPIFDKNTGKFKGSIYATSDAHFVMGPDSYSEYKNLVHEKKVKHDSKDPIKKSKSNKSNKQTKNNKSKINKSKTNKKTTNNSSSYTSKLNQHIPSIESNKTN